MANDATFEAVDFKGYLLKRFVFLGLAVTVSSFAAAPVPAPTATPASNAVQEAQASTPVPMSMPHNKKVKRRGKAINSKHDNSGSTENPAAQNGKPEIDTD